MIVMIFIEKNLEKNQNVLTPRKKHFLGVRVSNSTLEDR